MIFVWLLVCDIILTNYSLPFEVITAAYAVQLIGWVVIAGWGLWKGSKPVLPLLLWAWVFWLSQPASLVTSVELTRLLGFVGLYGLNLEADQLRRWADWLLLPVLALPWLFDMTNRNDLSMLIWVTLVVSNRRGAWAIVAGAIMMMLHSEAALVALVVALAVERWGYKVLLPAPLVMLMIGLLRPYGIMHDGRIYLWRSALQRLTVGGNGLPFEFHAINVYTSTPVVDTLYGYTHSLPVDVLYIAGLPGLGLLGVAGWWLWHNRAKFGPWSGFIAGFCAYSLVDYPHWSVPGAVLMIILSKYRKDQTNYGISLGRWLRLRFLAYRGYGAGLQRGPGVAPLSHQHRAEQRQPER